MKMTTKINGPIPIIDMFLMQTFKPLFSNKCPLSLRVLFTLPIKTHTLSPHQNSQSISSFSSSSSSSISMAEFHHQRPQNQPYYDSPTTQPFRAILPQKPLSSSHLLAFLTLFPIAALLLFLAGISFIGTVLTLALTSPLFLIFSPILVPAALVIAFSVVGFLTSGAFGVMALSSLSWMANYLRKSRVPLNLDQAKQWVRETAAQTAKEAGQAIQSKAQDVGKTDEVEVEFGPAQDGGKTSEVSPAQGGGRSEEVAPSQEGGTGRAPGTGKEETAQEGGKVQEPAKAQEGGKAQGGKGQGGKARGGGKT